MRYEVEFKVHVDGHMRTLYLCFTTMQFCGPEEGAMPSVTCSRCGERVAVIRTLRYRDSRVGQQGYLDSSSTCHDCMPEPVFGLPYYNGRLQLDFGDVRHENGETVKLFDLKSRRWTSAKDRGFRLMKPPAKVPPRAPLEARLQPYRDRHTNREGKKYN